MRIFIVMAMVLLTLGSYAQNEEYNVTRYSDQGIKAPNNHHLGEAWLNGFLKAGDDFPYNMTTATFSPNSTLDWHKHTTSQVLIVVDGEGYYQERGKDPMIMRKGDVIKCDKDTEHWHTSSAKSSVSYIAVYGNEPTIWTEKMTREYYDGVAKMLEEK